METKEKENKITFDDQKDDLKCHLNELIHSAIHILHDHSDKLLDNDPSNDAEGLKTVCSYLDEVFKLVRCRMNL